MDEPNGLNTLVHSYSSDRWLFRTITMYAEEERDHVCDSIADGRTWYGARYRKSERANYLLRRVTVEQMMRSQFEAWHGPVPSRTPVYFYIYPRLDEDRLQMLVEKRRSLGESNTKVVTFPLHDLSDIGHVSFTLEDSLGSYGKALEERGIPDPVHGPSQKCTTDRGTVFPMLDLRRVYTRHAGDSDVYFEVQVWDFRVLAPIAARLRTR